MNNKIPFRADQVGSLLRPVELKEARVKYAREEISLDELRDIEDQCIREVVATQEQTGLRAVTDGEFRRAWWQFDFLAGLDGVEWIDTPEGIAFHGTETKHEAVGVTGKVKFNGHYMLDHFRFLRGITKATPKMTIPAPPVLHFRGGRPLIDKNIYPDLDIFFSDTAEAYRKVVRAFYDAGCRYLQFDDTVWGYLCSEKERELSRQRGDDPDALPLIYRDVINHVLEEKPADMAITTHICRGNFRSTWISEGGYEPVAEILLGDLNYDGYFLEYDTDRAGGFEPLRFLPRGHKRVVLGLITSKTGELEDKNRILSRIEEATRFADLDQLCISPQCGFSSTEEGNILTQEDQWNKLGLVIDIAKEVWGEI